MLSASDLGNNSNGCQQLHLRLGPLGPRPNLPPAGPQVRAAVRQNCPRPSKHSDPTQESFQTSSEYHCPKPILGEMGIASTTHLGANMIWLIAEREFLDHLKSNRFVFGMILALTATLTVGVISTRGYEQRLRDYSEIGRASCRERV